MSAHILTCPLPHSHPGPLPLCAPALSHGPQEGCRPRPQRVGCTTCQEVPDPQPLPLLQFLRIHGVGSWGGFDGDSARPKDGASWAKFSTWCCGSMLLEEGSRRRGERMSHPSARVSTQGAEYRLELLSGSNPGSSSECSVPCSTHTYKHKVLPRARKSSHTLTCSDEDQSCPWTTHRGPRQWDSVQLSQNPSSISQAQIRLGHGACCPLSRGS